MHHLALIAAFGAKPVFEWLGAGERLALDIDMTGGGHSLKVEQQHHFVHFPDYVLFNVPLPGAVQMHEDPYLTAAAGGGSVYDKYYGGLGTMMPWRHSMPPPPQVATIRHD